MATYTEHEVIDLTASSPSPEVIVIDDDDSGPSKAQTPSDSRKGPNFQDRNVKQQVSAEDSLHNEGNKRSREGTGGSTSTNGTETGKEGEKRRRKKKRKIAVTQGEDGEIIEEGEMRSDEGPSQGTQSSRMNQRETGESSNAGAKASHSSRLGSDNTTRDGFGDDTSGSSRRSRKRKKGGKKDADKDSADGLFFFDDKPADVPTSAKPAPPPSLNQSKEDVLLLPAHVSVVGQPGVIPVEILPPENPGSEDDDFIDYLDYDDDRKGPGLVRYFDDVQGTESSPSKPRRVACKNCGEEGHSTKKCPHMICLTCGARDEHSTRGCPVSKTCFSCGMKGHITASCPNRNRRRDDAAMYDDCDRCGSSVHSTKECPTLWRMYEYVDDNRRQEILRIREEKVALPIGQGGEGYIASDEWCYNCGESGHLGDDCTEPHVHDIPREPSAFSEYNTRSGPFFDASRPEKPSKKSKREKKRDWERDGLWADGHGFTAPIDVGKQGRKKEKKRLEERLQATQDDDEGDWFSQRGRDGGKNKPASNRSNNGGSSSSRPKGGKITFGDMKRDQNRFSKLDMVDFPRSSRPSRDEDRRYGDLPRPMRETDSIQIRGAARRPSDDRRYTGGGGGRSYGSRYDERREAERGPRYRGGYSR
ncbi:hypothetical protein K474DRAFT_1767819 [Panus rudis PR-1116 ss-1]|nr:hypothetical protein K474DRAFT_1767819 [Panus rudis PR-1116 ss-1]